MSGGGTNNPTFGSIAPHTISYHKDILGWIPAAVKYTVGPGTSQTIEIERIGQSPSSPGNYLMAQIPIAAPQFYTVEARRFAGYDTRIPGEAVIIHNVLPSRSSRLPWSWTLTTTATRTMRERCGCLGRRSPTRRTASR